MSDEPYMGSNPWIRLAYVPGKPVPHMHSCPQCHRKVWCSMGCTLEPDLEGDDGVPFGSHCHCSETCAKYAAEILESVYGQKITLSYVSYVSGDTMTVSSNVVSSTPTPLTVKLG